MGQPSDVTGRHKGAPRADRHRHTDLAGSVDTSGTEDMKKPGSRCCSVKVRMGVFVWVGLEWVRMVVTRTEPHTFRG